MFVWASKYCGSRAYSRRNAPASIKVYTRTLLTASASSGRCNTRSSAPTSATPLGSINSRSGAKRATTSRIWVARSLRNEQQIQPLGNSTTSAPRLFKSELSTPTAPKSFTSTTVRTFGSACANIRRRKVVLPAPRKPTTTSTSVGRNWPRDLRPQFQILFGHRQDQQPVLQDRQQHQKAQEGVADRLKLAGSGRKRAPEDQRGDHGRHRDRERKKPFMGFLVRNSVGIADVRAGILRSGCARQRTH